MHLRIDNISKQWDGVTVLDAVSFDAGEHDLVCLLGPSGCGKTTLLRIMAGLTAADRGMVQLGGRDVSGLSPQERGFGVVFQGYALFPDMDVLANVAYPMRLRGVPLAQRNQRAHELLERVGLHALAQRFPGELSGGQQQRVAIARALAAEPGLLLLDEPFSALDPGLRMQLRSEVRSLQQSLGIPVIMVTHDQDEALSMADRIVCLHRGRVQQVGSPRALYERPASRFVATFVGRANLLPTAFVRQALPDFLVRRPPGVDAAYDLCVRPEDIELRADPLGEAVVAEVAFFGNTLRADIDWRGVRLVAELPGRHVVQPGESVTLDAIHGSWVGA
jgi:iron(III) transport system ATP-binding protein